MRKLAITTVAACLVVAIVLALLPQFLDVNHYRMHIQASFLPPSLIVNDVVIGEDPRFGAGPFAKAQELDVRVALIPLLRRDLQVKSLRLVNPDIELIKDQSSQWNYASLGQAPAPPQPPSGAAPQPGALPSVAPQLSLDHLQISNGRLRFI